MNTTQKISDSEETEVLSEEPIAPLSISHPLTPDDLTIMPTDWVVQLHQAVTKVNAKQINNLLEQIPNSSAYLAHPLSDLVLNFCFEEIVALTQPMTLSI